MMVVENKRVHSIAKAEMMTTKSSKRVMSPGTHDKTQAATIVEKSCVAILEP